MFVRSVFLASARRERDTRRCFGFSEQSSLTRPCRLWSSKTFVARKGITNQMGHNIQATRTDKQPTHSTSPLHIPQATNRSSRISEEGNKKPNGEHHTSSQNSQEASSTPHIQPHREASLYNRHSTNTKERDRQTD